jgi:hypothetical protein
MFQILMFEYKALYLALEGGRFKPKKCAGHAQIQSYGQDGGYYRLLKLTFF